MRGKLSSRFKATAKGILLLLLLAFNIVPVLAQRDRQAPTTPRNLRVTATSSYSVSLAWDASTDNSGQFSYIICCAYSNSATVPQTETSFTFTAGLEAGRTFSFRIHARDAAGNVSGYSNTVTVTLPADTQAPTKPVISVTEVGATHVALQLSSSDNGPNIWYTVFMNGTAIINQDRNAAPTITALQPATTYTFTVQARDFMGLLSPLSDPVTVTTAEANTGDTTAPTTPTNLSASIFEDGETHLSWGQSTDDVTPQSLIQYEIYVNGVLDHVLVGRGRTVVYGTVGIQNTFEVIAVDAAGNRSAPAVFTANIP